MNDQAGKPVGLIMARTNDLQRPVLIQWRFISDIGCNRVKPL